jgi:hypothetical protein
MVSLVNSHTYSTLKRWHLWEIDLRFALNSTPGWIYSCPKHLFVPTVSGGLEYAITVFDFFNFAPEEAL